MKSSKILLSLVLSIGTSGWAFDAEYTADKTVTISENGDYLVTGEGSGSVTVNENLKNVKLTIRDVTWTGNATKINIKNGAALSLVLEGSSSIIHTGDSNGSGINVPETSSLTVSGTGELNMQSRNWPCIGVAAGATMGCFTLNGGTVTAHAGGKGIQGLSAAIGGCYGMSKKGGNGGTVVVNGGKLVAVGYTDAPGIGGGISYQGGGGDAGTLTVNGGYVIAASRHIGNYCGDYASSAIGPGASRQNVAKHGAPGRITVTGGVLEAWVDRPAASCFGIAHNVGQAATVPEGAGLFVTGGTVKWNHLINDAPGFTYSFADCNVGCSSGPERAWAGLWLPVDTDLAAIFPEGVNFEKASGATVAANTIQLADLAAGDVALDSLSPFTVVGSSAASANKVVASGDIEAALCGVNSTSGWSVPANSTSVLWIYGGNEISVLANGTCYTLPETGTLDLRGTGFLYCENKNVINGNQYANSLQSAIGNSAANGKWGTLKVDGPTVEAIGSERSAGVGGGYTNSNKKGASGGGKVIVESGTLIARGKGGAAAIGGGSSYQGPGGSGPEVIVKTNGTIYAYNEGVGNGVHKDEKAGGVAIGAGCCLWDGSVVADVGSITVDGGKIYASVYKENAPCFGAGSGDGSFPANPNMTGSLTVRNGGHVFFSHTKFQGQYTVMIDNGTLGTMDDTPSTTWAVFNSLSIVTNALTIAGPVSPVLASLPSFKNVPVLKCSTGVNITGAMYPDEWVEIVGSENLSHTPAVLKRTKDEDGRALTRFDTLEGWVNLSEVAEEVYDITENGVYKFYGTGTASIRVAENVICTNVVANASIACAGAPSMELNDGSRVFLHLIGVNTMYTPSEGNVVVRVPEGAELTIADGADEGEATGSLTIDQSNLNLGHVVGIGEYGADKKMGALTIDSGDITILMRHTGNGNGGAAIGSGGKNSSCGRVTINGGRVTLDGPGLSPAIGAGYHVDAIGYGGDVTINGGVVTANGYGGASAIGLAAAFNKAGTPGTFTMNGGVLTAKAFNSGSYSGNQCGAAIGGAGARNTGGSTGSASTIGKVVFNGGNAYLHSDGAFSIGCGKSHDESEPVARAGTDSVVITGGNIYAPQGIQGGAVNGAGEKLALVSIPSSLFSEYPCTLKLDDATEYTFPETAFNDGKEHLWLPSGILSIDDKRTFIIGTEDDESPRPYTMTSGDNEVYIGGRAILSSAGPLSGSGVIVLSDGSETTFRGLDFTSLSGNGRSSTVVVEDKATAKIILDGDNSLKRLVNGSSVIHLPYGATLTVDGGADDYLRIEQNTEETMKPDIVGIGVANYDATLSMGRLIIDGGNVKVELRPGDSNSDTTGNIGIAVGVGSGNRNAGTVIVNGGMLFASSGAISPGIGGGYSYGGRSADGGNVIVNGGVLIAKGYGGSPGIGGGTTYGGTCGKGGSFTLNGGTVYAYAYENSRFSLVGRCGAAIGGPAERKSEDKHVGGMGTVTVNDGTLYAYAEVGAAIGHGNITNGTYRIENGSDGTFTIKGGSVKLVSGSDSAVSHVTPKNNGTAVSPVTVAAGKFGAPPYALEFVQRDVPEGAAPFAYPYHGSGYEDGGRLCFYLPYGSYRVNGRVCEVDEGGISFPGFTVIIR